MPQTTTTTILAARANAGRGAQQECLQRAITLHVEQVERDRLHVAIDALPADDPRREAWFSADEQCSHFFVAWPTATSAIDNQLFAEAFSTVFGLPSPGG